MRRGKRDDEEQALTGHNGWTRSHQIRVIFSQDIYCGGYSGEDPPLPIPNREVKLAIADGTAPPGGRVGSCHFLLETFEVIRLRRSFFVRGSESNPQSSLRSDSPEGHLGPARAWMYKKPPDNQEVEWHAYFKL